MFIQTIEALVEELTEHSLLDPPQHHELITQLQARFSALDELLEELLRRGWLTRYQVNQLVLGQAKELVLGAYVLQERIGEGTMGEVFKARHRSLGRVVALKLIRPKHLSDPDALHRFDREMRAGGRVSHPNVISAFDADWVEGRWFFTMEYIDGIDLGRLVHKGGPLPLRQACDYIRQAALGLQHAHECGIVHRDIKPTNLLVTPRPPEKPGSGQADDWGTIKLLDLGLARLRKKSGTDTSTVITKIGWVIGTPDFISPEQTKSAHNVDIRADLYSLGCTFYYLLAGAPPFGDVQGAHKFHKHRTEEPRPIEQWRADVPAAVGAVVRKLMAKRPEDRYQLPSQVGDSLASLIPSLPSTSQVEITPQRSPATRAAGAAPPEGWQPSRWLLPALGGLLLVLLSGLALVLFW